MHDLKLERILTIVYLCCLIPVAYVCNFHPSFGIVSWAIYNMYEKCFTLVLLLTYVKAKLPCFPSSLMCCEEILEKFNYIKYSSALWL